MADFAKTVAQIARLRDEQKAIDERIEELYGTLGDLEVRNYPAGDFILQVTRTVRFDEATAKRNLTAEQFKSILKLKPDSTLAKAVLDDDYSLTQRSYGLTRKIVRVDDAE